MPVPALRVLLRMAFRGGVRVTIQRCRRCNRLWVHSMGPSERFVTITQICADCVAAVHPVVAR